MCQYLYIYYIHVVLDPIDSHDMHKNVWSSRKSYKWVNDENNKDDFLVKLSFKYSVAILCIYPLSNKIQGLTVADVWSCQM